MLEIEELKINRSPNLLGYWCRVHGLSMRDCQNDPQLATIVLTREQQIEFNEGYGEADEELFDEALRDKKDKLLQSLQEAYDPVSVDS